MIVSHKHRFIYIKTHKTGSTSVEATLARLCGPDDIVTPASRERMAEGNRTDGQNYRLEHPLVPKRPLWRRLLGRPERHYHPSVGYYEHMPAWRIKAYVGDDVWRAYFKFTFERNSWDKQVSWYFYKTKTNRSRPEFERFLRNARGATISDFDLYSLDGVPAMDFIGRYENLGEDFGQVCERVGLEIGNLPKLNVSDARTRDYRNYYDDRSRDAVARIYRREIEFFGYEF